MEPFSSVRGNVAVNELSSTGGLGVGAVGDRVLEELW